MSGRKRVSRDRIWCPLGGKLQPSLGIFATISPIRAVLALINHVHHAATVTRSPNMSETRQ